MPHIEEIHHISTPLSFWTIFFYGEESLPTAV